MRKLPLIVAETPIGDTVPVKLWRDGKETEVQLRVSEMANVDSEETDKQPDHKLAEKNKGEKIEGLGISVSKITPALRQKYNLGEKAKGLVVINVDPKGVLVDKGVREGDIIREAGGQDVDKESDLIARVEEAGTTPDKPLLLLVDRGGDSEFIAVQIAKKK